MTIVLAAGLAGCVTTGGGLDTERMTATSIFSDRIRSVEEVRLWLRAAATVRRCHAPPRKATIFAGVATGIGMQLLKRKSDPGLARQPALLKALVEDSIRAYQGDPGLAATVDEDGCMTVLRAIQGYYRTFDYGWRAAVLREASRYFGSDAEGKEVLAAERRSVLRKRAARRRAWRSATAPSFRLSPDERQLPPE